MAQSITVERDQQRLAQLAQPEQFEKFVHPLLDGGIRTDKNPSAMSPNELSAAQNLKILAGRLVVDTGYSPLGSQVVGPQLTYQVFYPNGTDDLLLVALSTVYRFNATANQWQYVTWGQTYATSAAQISGGNTFTLVAIGSIVIGSIVGVGLDDGSNLNTSVLNVAGTIITTADPVPAGRHVAVGAPVALAATLNGNYSTQVCMEEFVDGAVYITNGVDPVFFFKDLVLTPVPIGGNGLPADTVCQWILTFHEQLYLFSTIEGGQAFPQRVRGSDQANASVWLPTSLGGPGGLQIIYDLNDTEDFILTAAVLGPWMIMYRETTIMRASYLGLLDETLFWEYMIYSEGALSQGAVSQVGDAHLLVGTSGVYLYRGDYTLESIGEAIFIGYFSAIGLLNPTAKSQLFTQYIGDYDEVWVFFPVVGVDAPMNNLIVELDNNGWYPRQYQNQFVSAAPYLPLADTTWADAPGTWADYTRPWNSRIFTKNVPNMLLCCPDAQRVMIYDYTTKTDNGLTILWDAETKDWLKEGYKLRTDSIRLYGRGNGVQVDYAIDGGDDQFDDPPTWTPIGVVNFGTRQNMQILTFQIVTDHIRFRFSGSDPDFVMLWAECWYLEESEW
jgi:hypothetical protein